MAGLKAIKPLGLAKLAPTLPRLKGRAGATPRLIGRPWRRLRDECLKRANWLCVACDAAGRTRPADEVDHIKPLEDGGNNHQSNLQALCRECHREKTNREAAANGMVRHGGP